MNRPGKYRVLGGLLLWLLFFAGISATVLLAIATRDINTLGGVWLATLLEINQVILVLLVLGVVHALWRILRNRVRLVGNLMWALLAQLLVALIIAVMPLVLIFTAAEDYYGSHLDDAIDASDSIRSSILNQEIRLLDLLVVELQEQLRDPTIETGTLLDNTRIERDLSLLALVDHSGQPLLVSPPEASPPELSPIMLQLVSEGSGSRQLTEDSDGLLRLVWFVPLKEHTTELGQTPSGLWLERPLPRELSDDIRTVEDGVRSYRNSRSVREGVRQGLQLVLTNAIVLLMFSSLSMAAHLGNRLGRRLDRINAKMVEVAGLEEPSGEVPVSGNDEITAVSHAFNEMIRKVGASVSKEKRHRAMLETVQETMDAGLLVLDGSNLITASNPAASELLRGEQSAEQFSTAINEDPNLANLAQRQPETNEFVDWILAAEFPASGEVTIGSRKLLVRTAAFEVPGSPQPRVVVLFTDISEPLAHGESRVREDAFSFTLHGINNPLQAALIQTELLERKAAKVEDETARNALSGAAEKILHQLQRIHAQTRAWSMISGMEKVQFAGVDLNGAVQELINNAELGLLQVELELAAGLPQIWSEKNMLYDTLENLLTNAKEQFGTAAVEQQHIRITTRMEKEVVSLHFTDNAGGIDPEVLPQIFTPHKSFKVGGHGIGLARVHDWLLQVDATIAASNVDDQHGTGACFIVNFLTETAGKAKA